MKLFLAACAAVLGTTLLAAGCSSEQSPAPARAGMANPASVYCIEQGGRLEIVRDDKGDRGVCILSDGRRVDEWEFFRTKSPSSKK